jgi:hypothetical protein
MPIRMAPPHYHSHLRRLIELPKRVSSRYMTMKEIRHFVKNTFSFYIRTTYSLYERFLTLFCTQKSKSNQKSYI